METKVTQTTTYPKIEKEVFQTNAPIKLVKVTPIEWKKEETFYTYDEILNDYTGKISGTQTLAKRCKLLEEVIEGLSKKLEIANSPTRRGKITDREKWTILELSENYGKWSMLYTAYGEEGEAVEQENVAQTKLGESQEALLNFINKLLIEQENI